MRAAGQDTSPAPTPPPAASVPGAVEEEPRRFESESPTSVGRCDESKLFDALRTVIRVEFVSLAPELCSRIVEGLNKHPRVASIPPSAPLQPLGHQPLGHQPLGHQPMGHQSVGHQPVGHQSRVSGKRGSEASMLVLPQGPVQGPLQGPVQGPVQGHHHSDELAGPWCHMKSFKVTEQLKGAIQAEQPERSGGVLERSRTWGIGQAGKRPTRVSKARQSIVKALTRSNTAKLKNAAAKKSVASKDSLGHLPRSLSKMSGGATSSNTHGTSSTPHGSGAVHECWAAAESNGSVHQLRPTTPLDEPTSLQLTADMEATTTTVLTTETPHGRQSDRHRAEDGISSATASIFEASLAHSAPHLAEIDSEDDDDDYCDSRPRPRLLRAATRRVQEAFRARVARIVSSNRFDFFVAVLVVLNAVAIGVQTNWVAVNQTNNIPSWMRAMELFFCACFVGELSVRFAALGLDMFRNPGWEWNAFDCLVVGLQLLEEVLGIIESSTGGNSQIPSFGAMRVLRILRLIRIVRFVRIMRLIGELRTLVTSITSSIRCLLWSLLLIGATIYMVGVFFVQVVSDHRITATQVDEDLIEFFGTLERAILALFETITGGISWHGLASALGQDISPLLEWIFVFYVAFAVLAMLNVVTGIFVQTATVKAKDQDDLFMINNVLELFPKNEIKGGVMTIVQFEKQLRSPKMLDYFRSIDIDPSAARALYSLLDVNNTGAIETEEFLAGCLHLRGPAKALDLQVLMREVLSLKEIFREHAEWLERATVAAGGDHVQSASAPLVGRNNRVRLPQGQRQRRGSLPDQVAE